MKNSSRSRANNRLVPAVILGTFVLVVVASTLLFRAAATGKINLPALLGTKNNGVLITPPQRFGELPLREPDGQPFDYASQPKRWSIVIPVAAQCDQQCEQTLYMTRQIHIALGKDANRVRRYLVATQWPLDQAFVALLEREHPNLHVLVADIKDFSGYFSRLQLQPVQNHQFLLVDPMGWLMMYYNPGHDYKAIIKDLKFLLSNSSQPEGAN